MSSYNNDDDRQSRNPNIGQTTGFNGATQQQSGFGHPVYDQIGDFVQQATGRKATMQDVSQWGTNVDANYMGHIRNAIYNSAEAKAYAAKQAQGQQQTQQTDPAQTPPPAPSGGGSPVTANGQIAPPSAASTVQAPPPAPPPPEYKAAHFNVAMPNAYQAPSGPLASYGGDKVSQFNPLDQSAQSGQENALLSAILQNPQTLSPSILAQMKESGKEQALAMQQQSQQGLDQAGVARGTLGGGAALAARLGLQDNAINAILKSNRDLDVNAAQTNRQDELNALNASEGVLSGQMGRATQGYNTQLAGQTAQAGINRESASSQLQSQVAAEQMRQAQFDSLFRNAGLGFDVQKANADEGYRAHTTNVAQNFTNTDQNMNLMKFLEMQEEFRRTLAENQRQFNGNLGYNYNSLDQNGQISLLNWLPH